MITKDIKKYLLIFPVLFLLASCDKLDISPSDTIDPSAAFRNIKDVNMGILGVYGSLGYTLTGNNVTVSDEAVMPQENNVTNTSAYRWLYTPGSGSVTSAFYELYVSIDRANRVLAAIDRIKVKDNELELKEQYRGELLALRAYCHFELLRAYASAYQADALGIAYMKTSSIGYPARESFGAVITNIKDDLIQAKPLISSSFSDRTRITKNAVSAIQARVALYEKNWTEAVTYATEAIQAQPLASLSDFPEIWTDISEQEVIWKLKRVAGDTPIGGFFFRQNGGIVLYAPSGKLISTFDKDKDIRYTSYIAFDPDRGNGKSQYQVKKYAGRSNEAAGLTDIKLFRTAEMYLIRAEAEAELSGQLNAASNDLNTLRANRINGYVNQAFSGKEALITAIYTERFKELAFEGHRFFDLKRRNLPVERLAEDAVNTAGSLRLDPSKAQYAFPIPAQEIAVNKNMVQNPKYSDQ